MREGEGSLYTRQADLFGDRRGKACLASWEFFMPLRGTQNWGKMSQSALFQSSAGVPPAFPEQSAERRQSSPPSQEGRACIPVS